MFMRESNKDALISFAIKHNLYPVKCIVCHVAKVINQFLCNECGEKKSTDYVERLVLLHIEDKKREMNNDDT